MNSSRRIEQVIIGKKNLPILLSLLFITIIVTIGNAFVPVGQVLVQIELMGRFVR